MREKISDEARLRHIYDAILNIEEFTYGMGISGFLKNNLVKNATVRQLEIIGEAANHLSSDLKDKYNEVNWKEIVGFRNIVIHEYFIIDYSVIWNIIENFIPTLKTVTNKILQNEFKN